MILDMDMVLIVFLMEIGIQGNGNRTNMKDMDATTSKMVQNIYRCTRMIRRIVMESKFMQ